MSRRPTISKSQGGIVILLLTCLMLVCGGLFSLTGLNVLGIPSPTVSPTIIASLPPVGITNTPFQPVTDTPEVVNSGTGWWDLYFTDPLNVKNPNQWQDSIEGKLVERINAAQASIHIASFEFDLTPVAQALIAAKQRGVDVRWVTDDENGTIADEEPGRGQFAMLKAAGIEVRDDSPRNSLMHDKFWIFDKQIVWTGSTNITVNGIFKQNNNTIVIHSPELAAMYEREFDELWNGKFGPKAPSHLDQQSLALNGTSIQVLFSAQDHVINHLIEYVNGAQTSIRFLAFSFTDYPLAKAMIDRSAVGVDVRGVYEKVGSDAQGAEMRTFLCAKVPVRQDGNPSFMHHKVIVIDNHLVLTGSLNYSSSADDANEENVTAIDNADIAKLYLQEFDRVWNQGTDPDPAKFPCQ